MFRSERLGVYLDFAIYAVDTTVLALDLNCRFSDMKQSNEMLGEAVAVLKISAFMGDTGVSMTACPHP